jgi:hypothetical protein
MASTFNILICAGLAVVLWACIGLPITARIAPRPLDRLMAPALGWAIHSAIALPLFRIVGMSRAVVIIAFIVPVIAATVAPIAQRSSSGEARPFTRVSIVALIGSGLLALGIMAAMLPKVSADGVALAAPIFDHSKVSMVNEMVRLGVPPGNPFFGEAGAPYRLSYYYLWHFSAAELALLAGVSGWEADAGLTWFTAFASFALMIGFAVWLSGRASSALWVIVLAASASMRPVLSWIIGADNVINLVGWDTGFGGWQFQTTWAPQHTASAMCAVMAAFLLVQLARRQSTLLLLIFALVMVAGFESSTWVGGVTFPPAAAAISLLMLTRCDPPERSRIVLWLAIAAIGAIGLASPMLYNQFMMTALRGGGSPIVIEPYAVLGDDFPAEVRRILDLPAYWLLFLVVEFPAYYLTGAVTLAFLSKDRGIAGDRKPVILAFAILTVISLSVGWLLVSTLGDNNDLSWRGVLPAILLLIVFSAVGLSKVLQRPTSLAAVCAVSLVALGLPQGAMLLYGNVVVEPEPTSKVFAATPAMWAAVRHHSSASDRIANNPHFLDDMTPWPINISWALLSNRRSCYAGRDFAIPFTALTKRRRQAIDAQFLRVFAGDATQEDIGQLANQYNCSLVVVTAQDGAWTRDPFAASPVYRLVEQDPAGWRIYRAVKLARR